MIRDRESKVVGNRKRDGYYPKGRLWICYCSFKPISRGEEERHWALTVKELLHLSSDGIQQSYVNWRTSSMYAFFTLGGGSMDHPAQQLHWGPSYGTTASGCIVPTAVYVNGINSQLAGI
jgi:hypothetical protein